MEPAVFQLSGGTTRVPKIIPRRHNDYSINFKAVAEITRVTEGSVMGIAIPINQNFVLNCPGLCGTLYKGGNVVLIPSPKTETAFEAIEREKITIMPTLPALLIRWMEAPELPNMFEDGEVRVVDENDRDVPYGEPGELLVRGPTTLGGYYNSPEYHKKAFTADGFCRTGDVVTMYRGRYLSVEGRTKDTINRGAEKISGEQVEKTISSLISELRTAPRRGIKVCPLKKYANFLGRRGIFQPLNFPKG